jgi:hypothetical protein
VSAAASSNVGFGGGGSGCFLTGGRTGFAKARRGAGFAVFVTFETRFGAFVLVAALTGRFGADFIAIVTFEAFCARALPAGERLVAGFSPVDFNTRFAPLADFDDERSVERDDSLFSGLLINTGGTRKKPRLNSGAA